MGALLYFLIPAHLFVAYLIELVAASQARLAQPRTKKDEEPPKAWLLIACAHAVNATLSLGVANYVVYYNIHHPMVGTLCEFHAGRLF